MKRNEMENIRDEVQKHLGNDYKVELVEVPKTGGIQKMCIRDRYKGYHPRLQVPIYHIRILAYGTL